VTAPGIGFRRTIGRAARHPWVWRARDLDVNALSGQTATHTRAATATPTDSFAATRTVAHSQPAWHYTAAKSVTGLLLGTNADVSYALPILPQAMGGGIHFIENGGKAIVGGGVWYEGNDAGSGARIYLDATGTVYRLTYTDGTTTRTATMATAPSTGDEVWLRWTLTSAGVCQIWQSINGAAETTPGAAAATVLPAAWAGTTMRLNRLGTGTRGNTIYLDGVVMLGAPTLAQIQVVVA